MPARAPKRGRMWAEPALERALGLETEPELAPAQAATELERALDLETEPELAPVSPPAWMAQSNHRCLQTKWCWGRFASLRSWTG